MAKIRQLTILLVGVIQLELILAHSVCRPDWIGDGFCDRGCNRKRYNFDDGDCCPETCKSRPRVFDCDLYGYRCKPQAAATTIATQTLPTTTTPLTSSTQTPTEPTVPDWFTETEMCYKWRADGSSGQCGIDINTGLSVANELCASTGELTTFYRDDTDGRPGGCRMQWGIRYVL